MNELIRMPPGEAESGSAGVQPDKEYPGRRRTDVRAPEEPKTSGAFLFHRSPELCLQNAPRSFGATGPLHGSLLQLGRRHAGLAVPKAFRIERLLLPQHLIDGPTQPCGQDAQGLGLAVFLLLPRQEALGLVALARQEAGGLGEGPLQMGVADLGSAAALDLARRCLQRPDQPGVR